MRSAWTTARRHKLIFGADAADSALFLDRGGFGFSRNRNKAFHLSLSQININIVLSHQIKRSLSSQASEEASGLATFFSSTFLAGGFSTSFFSASFFSSFLSPLKRGGVLLRFSRSKKRSIGCSRPATHFSFHVRECPADEAPRAVIEEDPLPFNRRQKQT